LLLIRARTFLCVTSSIFPSYRFLLTDHNAAVERARFRWSRVQGMSRSDRWLASARISECRTSPDAALRQAEILAAAGLYAFDHNVQHLHEDHLNAHSIAERIAALPGITLHLGSVQTSRDLQARSGDARCRDDRPPSKRERCPAGVWTSS
jgi:hypothetical protein